MFREANFPFRFSDASHRVKSQQQFDVKAEKEKHKNSENILKTGEK